MHQVPDRHRAEAQDVLAQSCHVCGSSSRAVLLVARSVASGGHVLVDPVEQPGQQAQDLTQALRYAPLPSCLPVAGHVEETVAHEREYVDLAAFCSGAAGLVSNECSGWSGWRRGTNSAGMGDLLVCERPVDGASWTRKLVVVQDVLQERHVPTAAASWSVRRTAAA